MHIHLEMNNSNNNRWYGKFMLILYTLFGSLMSINDRILTPVAPSEAVMAT